MPEPLRILVLSGLGTDSGCMVRARYLTRALVKAGACARLAPGIRTLPLFLDQIVISLWNLRLLFHRCDVIIGCKPLPSITPLLILKGLHGTTTVLDVDDVDFAYRTGAARWIVRRLQQPFPKRCDMVTYHNGELIAALRDTFGVTPERLFQLPQGVDTDIFQPKKDAAEPKATREHVIVYPAHLNIACDLDVILDVVRLARMLLPNLRLIVIGGGPRARHFRALARVKAVDDVTTFTGYVPPERIPAYLAMGNVGIAYYKDVEVNRYRASMKLREMLACGLKVVTTDVGELKQFAAFTYQAPPEPERFAQMLVSVLTEGGDGREIAGSAFVRREMAWSTIGKRLHDRLVTLRREKEAEVMYGADG